jgi:insulysin
MRPTFTDANDAEFLKTISKPDLISFFMQHVHPSSPTRAKLSVHMQSQKPPVKHVSEAAAGMFATMLQEAGLLLPSSDINWREGVMEHGAPSVPDFLKFWGTSLSAQAGPQTQPDPEKVAKAKEIFEKLLELLARYPDEGDSEGKLREDVVLIEDVKKFKDGLEVTDLPKPLVEWGDLPVSKM